MKLYEIDQKIAEIFENMSVDEETGEVLLDTEALEELQEARQDKLEGAALYVKDLDAMAKAIREEEKALAKRRQVMETKAERIKAWLIYSLQGEKLETARVKLSVRKAPQVTVIDDPYAVRHWFVEEIIKNDWEQMTEDEREEYRHVSDLLAEKDLAPQYSKAGIKKLMEEGYLIEGAHIEDGKPSLVIK